MIQTTETHLETETKDQQHIIKLLELQGIKTSQRSYITKAAKALPTLKNTFTVPTMAGKAGIPRSKGYPTIRLLEELHLVSKVSKVERPQDWAEYTRSMRKRFNNEHGLPRRGIEPQRYMYTPRARRGKRAMRRPRYYFMVTFLGLLLLVLYSVYYPSV